MFPGNHPQALLLIGSPAASRWGLSGPEPACLENTQWSSLPCLTLTYVLSEEVRAVGCLEGCDAPKGVWVHWPACAISLPC